MPRHAEVALSSVRGVLIATVLMVLFVLAHAQQGATGQSSGADPWASSQVLQPADLAKQLTDPKGKKPLIVCVGFEFLYKQAHIPGATFHGPAGKPGGLEDLKKWARTVSKEQPVVIYCGCCPMAQCPNVRPAFKALRDMGFKRLQVLYLGADFAADWVQRGFPVEPVR